MSLDIQEIETAGESVTKKKDRKDKNGKKEGSDGEDQVGVCDVWMCVGFQSLIFEFENILL